MSSFTLIITLYFAYSETHHTIPPYPRLQSNKQDVKHVLISIAGNNHFGKELVNTSLCPRSCAKEFQQKKLSGIGCQQTPCMTSTTSTRAAAAA